MSDQELVAPADTAEVRRPRQTSPATLLARSEQMREVCDLIRRVADTDVTVLVRGEEARLTFRRDAAPRLAALGAALDAVQFEADVRRSVPLALRLRRLGGAAIGPGLVRALAALAPDTR